MPMLYVFQNDGAKKHPCFLARFPVGYFRPEVSRFDRYLVIHSAQKCRLRRHDLLRHAGQLFDRFDAPTRQQTKTIQRRYAGYTSSRSVARVVSKLTTSRSAHPASRSAPRPRSGPKGYCGPRWARLRRTVVESLHLSSHLRRVTGRRSAATCLSEHAVIADVEVDALMRSGNDDFVLDHLIRERQLHLDAHRNGS